MLSLRQNKNSSFPGHAPGKDTLRAANAATEKGSTGENARANVVSRRALSPVKIKFPVATADMRRHSDTLRGAQRRRKRGLRGENRISKANSVVFPSFIVVPRQNKVSRRDGGHAPPQRHPERSAATTKTRFTGRKQNKRSEFCCLPVFYRCLPAITTFFVFPLDFFLCLWL